MSGFVLGVDLDGVCGDHESAFRDVVASERRIDPATLGPQRTWDFTEWGLDRDGFERLHRIGVVEHRMFRSMPVVPGAAESLWRLSDAGVWIRLITHRLFTSWGHAIAVRDTVDWLDANSIPYRDLCFLGDKPQVEADAYIDDAPHNVVALRAIGAEVLVFDQPYNASLDGPRARSWTEAERWVLERVAAREGAVQPPIPLAGDVRDRLRRRGGDEPVLDGQANSTNVRFEKSD